MKLAEALLLRADRNRTLEQIKQRIQVSARYQEGENPPENARDLVSCRIDRARRARGPDPEHQSDQLEHRHGRWSHRDRCTAERDVLRLRYSMLKVSAEAASGAQQNVGFMRATRSELKLMRALDVRSLRAAGLGYRPACP